MIGMLRDELSDADKDFLDALKFVHDGLRSPYVRWEVTQTLRKVLVILSDEASIHKQGLTVPTSIVIVSAASQLLENLRDVFADPKCPLCHTHREGARDVIALTGYDLSQALSGNTRHAVGQICSRIIPAQVEYSIMYIVKGCAEVYVGDADLVESLSVSLNASLKKNKVASTAIVSYAEHGNTLTGIRCGCRRNRSAVPAPAQQLGHEVPSTEQPGVQNAVAQNNEEVQDETLPQEEHTAT
jgi:hypothetical protein